MAVGPPSSCCPFCPSCGHGPAALRAVAGAAAGAASASFLKRRCGPNDGSITLHEDGFVLLNLGASRVSLRSSNVSDKGSAGRVQGAAHFSKIGDDTFLSSFSCSLGCGISNQVVR